MSEKEIMKSPNLLEQGILIPTPWTGQFGTWSCSRRWTMGSWAKLHVYLQPLPLTFITAWARQISGSIRVSDGDYSYEIKRRLLLGRKAMTNLDSILRNITLLTKVCIAKTMVFPVVMYGCKSWIIKKAECPRTDAFKSWCWRRLLESLGEQGDQTSQS